MRIFSRWKQLIENFDVNDVLANPARFDIKKAEAINGTHIRMLAADDFRAAWSMPARRNVGGGHPDRAEEEILAEAAPLIQERIRCWARPGGSLLPVQERRRHRRGGRCPQGLPGEPRRVLDAAMAALEPVTGLERREHPGGAQAGTGGGSGHQAAAGLRPGPHGASPAAGSPRRCSNPW